MSDDSPRVVTDPSVEPRAPALTLEKTRRLEQYRALIDDGWVSDEVGEQSAPEDALASWNTWLGERAAADGLALATKVVWGVTGRGGGWIVVAMLLGPHGETIEPTPLFRARDRELESRKLRFALREALGSSILLAAHKRVVRDLVNWDEASAIADALERDGDWFCTVPYDVALLDAVGEIAKARGFRVEHHEEDTHARLFAHWPRTAAQEEPG